MIYNSTGPFPGGFNCSLAASKSLPQNSILMVVWQASDRGNEESLYSRNWVNLVLHIGGHRGRKVVSDPDEMEAVALDAVQRLDATGIEATGRPRPGGIVWFSHGGWGVAGGVPSLTVATNSAASLGALMWISAIEVRGAMGSWVSDARYPPEVDPLIVADPGRPTFHHPRSCIPIADIHKAVLEFCQKQDGSRPLSVSWAESAAESGERIDLKVVWDGRSWVAPTVRKSPGIRDRICNDPWCSRTHHFVEFEGESGVAVHVE